ALVDPDGAASADLDDALAQPARTGARRLRAAACGLDTRDRFKVAVSGRFMRSSIAWGARASRQRSGRRLPVPIRTIRASCCGSRTPGSHRRRAPSSAWREVTRFFCAHPATVEEMDDFRDYLADCHRRNWGFSLKGRTLASLGRQMHEWQRRV